MNTLSRHCMPNTVAQISLYHFKPIASREWKFFSINCWELIEPGSQMGQYNSLVLAKNEEIDVIAPLGIPSMTLVQGNPPRRKTMRSMHDCSIQMEEKVT